MVFQYTGIDSSRASTWSIELKGSGENRKQATGRVDTYVEIAVDSLEVYPLKTYGKSHECLKEDR